MAPAESEDASRRSRVLAAIRAAADPDGFVPFDRFMEAALYSEGAGYYARPTSPLGPQGDFYTAVHVHPLFAATFAERIAAIRRRFPTDRPFLIVELGPGDGRLAEGVTVALGRRPEGTRGVSVVLVERSAPLRARAVERVRAVADPLGVPVHARDSVGSLGAFEGVVVANELLDAQPVRRLRKAPAGWVDLGVRERDGRLVPAEASVPRPVPGPALPEDAAEGSILEVSPVAEALVREVADHLVGGAFLLDDYGMEERELLVAHPQGTLDGVRAHRSGWDPLEAPGETDLSAFVNFTRLRKVAASAGLAITSDRRQAEALGEWGFPRLFEEAVRSAGSSEAEVRLRLAVKNLLFGFERFRILELEPARGSGSRAR